MAAFADHDRSYVEWWADVSQYLGYEATAAYEYTDPMNVPASTVTGDPQVVSAPTATEMSVLIPTDIGQYRIDLNRQAIGGQWTVSRFTPPEGVL